jgi:hypothetical protein
LLIKLKKKIHFPAYAPFEKQGYARTKVVAIGPRSRNQGLVSTYMNSIESQADLDAVAETCDTVHILFEGGSYIELPYASFITIFQIVPEGQLTGVIYGDD